MTVSVTSTQLLADPIGAYPAATVACYDPTMGEPPRRTLDEARTIAFLEKLAAVGAPAVLIAASTGHGHLRTADELATWLCVAAQADLGATIKMALLRPEDGEEDNRRLVAMVADLGYPVVFIRPGNNLPSHATDEQAAENMRPLLQAAHERGLAVGLYSIPDVSGLPMSPAAAAILVQSPVGKSIVAIKVTEADYGSSTGQFLDHPALAHLKIVQGWDPHLAQALQDGPRHDSRGRQRCGVTSGPMSFAIHQYLHILQAAAQQDWEEVAAAQAAVTDLFTAMQDDPRKFADLQRAKYIMGLGQPLTSEVRPEQIERVLTALRNLRRPADRHRLARSLDLMEDGPFHDELESLAEL